jgi:RNA polymerase sigma factor (sigma-70 family)
MNDRPDARLLRDYADQGDEAAFREIVARHADLVYSSALRQVESPDLAADIAQQVFGDLARKAKPVSDQLRAEASVSGWLHRSTRYAVLKYLRDTRRRIANERQAMEQLLTNAEPPPEWELIRPTLDEALDSLDDEDREAVLLRYFKNRDFRTVGRALGVNDDAAQKRVSRAVERLRTFFAKRGVSVGQSGLATLLSAHAVHAAPAGLTGSISASALAGAGFSTAISVTHTITMTTLQKTLIAATIAVLAGSGIYEARQVSQWRGQAQFLEQQQAQLAERNRQLQMRETPSNELATLQQENERLRRTTAQLPQLRGELARLRAMEKQLTQLKSATEQSNDPFTKSVLTFIARAAELNQQLEQKPQLRIPELAMLNETDWIEAGKIARLGSETEVRQSLMMLRSRAKASSFNLWQHALKAYLKASNGQPPTDPLQLKPYFETQIDDAMLQRYKMAPDSTGGWLIEEKSPVDENYDTRMKLGLDSLDISPVGAFHGWDP